MKSTKHAQKKRAKKYTPRPVLTNPVGYVLENITPLTKHKSYFLDLCIKNHNALNNLTKGEAKKIDILILIYAANMFEALCRNGIFKEYLELSIKAQQCILSLGKRKQEKNLPGWICSAEEMKIFNEFLEIHDAQLETCTVKDIDDANKQIDKNLKQKNFVEMV